MSGSDERSGADRGLRVVCVAGPSDAGKTTLVERLVPRLAECGRVGTVKSIHHDVEIDTPGADTHRHRLAGADAVTGVTPRLTFDIAPGGKEAPPADSDAGWLFDGDASEELRALEAVLAGYRRQGFDVVLVEGFTEAPLATILVGDRAPGGVPGDVIGRGTDELETLVGTIRALDPIG